MFALCSCCVAPCTLHSALPTEQTIFYCYKALNIENVHPAHPSVLMPCLGDSDCSAASGGGVFIAGATADTVAPGDTVTLVNITSTLMDFNTAQLPTSVGSGTATLLSTESGGSAYSAASAGAGGAIYLDGGVTVLKDNTFNSNTAATYGGALAYKQERYIGISSTGQLTALCICCAMPLMWTCAGLLWTV